MIYNLLANVLELMKYYIIMRFILGYAVRESQKKWLLVGGMIAIFSYSQSLFGDESIIVFFAFFILQMCLTFKEKIGNIILTEIWIILIVSTMDKMVNLSLEIVLGRNEIAFKGIEILINIVTIVYLTLIALVIRVKMKGRKIRVSKVYYIYLILITIISSLIMVALERVVESDIGGQKMKMFVLAYVFIVFVNIALVIFLAVSKDRYKRSDKLNRKYLEQQKQYYIYLQEKNESIRRFKHDVTSHFVIINEYLEGGNCEAAQKYIETIEGKVLDSQKSVTVGNGFVDAILTQYMAEAEKLGINIDVKGKINDNCAIEAYDLCVIFTNLLKNAIEAVKDVEEKNISIKVKQENKEFELSIENSFIGERIEVNGEYITTKKDKENHGIGILNVRESVKKYNGTLLNSVVDNKFISHIKIKNV